MSLYFNPRIHATCLQRGRARERAREREGERARAGAERWQHLLLVVRAHGVRGQLLDDGAWPSSILLIRNINIITISIIIIIIIIIVIITVMIITITT